MVRFNSGNYLNAMRLIAQILTTKFMPCLTFKLLVHYCPFNSPLTKGDSGGCLFFALFSDSYNNTWYQFIRSLLVFSNTPKTTPLPPFDKGE